MRKANLLTEIIKFFMVPNMGMYLISENMIKSFLYVESEGEYFKGHTQQWKELWFYIYCIQFG